MRKFLFILASGLLAFRPSAFAQVARVTNQQSVNNLLLTGVVSPAQITSNQNNYSPAGIASASVLRLNTDASRNITGLVAPATAGQVISLLNIGSFPVVLQAENSSSTAANRFTLAADYIVAAKTSVLLWYDGATSRWQMLGSSGTSGALLAANNLSDVLSAATSRTNLGLAIGTNVEAWSATLDTWATKTPPSGTVVGTTDTQSLTNKTETSPKIVTSILDSNGNIYVTLTAATSAVNYVNFTNAATGNSPTWTATGSDSDISLTFAPKNNGRFIASKLQLGSGVASTTLTDQVNIYGASAADTRIGTRYAAGAGTAVGGGFDFTLSRGSLGSPSAIQSGDVPFSILVGGYGNSAWQNNQASLYAITTENWSSGHEGIQWVIGGTPNSSTTQATFLTIGSVLIAGTGPTTLTDTTGKILSAALNTVAPGQGGTGVANTGTITLGGNLVTSGAFNLTLTQTATTNVTLPTTGTLATLAGAESFSSKTLVSPIISTGLTASGSAANDFSGSTGAFKISTGASTFGGSSNTFTNAVTISATTSSSSTTTGSGIFGGGIGVAGSAYIGGTLNVTGNIGINANALSYAGFYMNGTTTASTGLVYGIRNDNTLVAAANGDSMKADEQGVPFNTGTFTGLATYNFFANQAKTGTGTIDNAYGYYQTSLTMGTNNWAFYGAGTGMLFLGDTTEATTSSAGSAIFNGGVAIAKKIITGSSITTAAPSGGTAAPWKFGTVSVTSPTSPNRTIELDVSGTRYFLAAKTTND